MAALKHCIAANRDCRSSALSTEFPSVAALKHFSANHTGSLLGSFHGVPLRGRIEALGCTASPAACRGVALSTEFPSVAALKHYTLPGAISPPGYAFHGVPLRGRIEATTNCMTFATIILSTEFPSVAALKPQSSCLHQALDQLLHFPRSSPPWPH